MCIVFLAISENPKEDGYKVVIAMNRDEYFHRPTKEAQFYNKGDSDIIAGFDICSGSEGATWLGMSNTGRIGILTNYRQSEKFIKRNAKRRGKLITNFLESTDTPHKYIEQVKETGTDYKGFNLIVGNISPGESPMDFRYYCNQEHEPCERLRPGVYALSNRYLNYGWKKVVLGKTRFQKILKRRCSVKKSVAMLMEMLQDETRYPDDELFVGPQDDGLSQSFLEGFTATSVSLVDEQPPCGTRTNTVIIVDNEDNATFVERTMVEPILLDNVKWKTNVFNFKIH